MVELRAVRKAFGGLELLRGIDLRLSAGEAVVLAGPSGCGKTTLLRLVAGLDAPDAGEILLGGKKASADGRVLVPPHRRGVGVVFQEPRLWPHLSVRENIGFGLSGSSRAERAARVDEVAGWTGLRPLLARMPAHLSGGEARRVAVARALAPGRPILLMDEPLVNLDGGSAREMLAMVREVWEKERFALVLVTHDPEEVGGFGGRVVSW